MADAETLERRQAPNSGEGPHSEKASTSEPFPAQASSLTVSIVDHPQWAIQYQTSDSQSDWLELGPTSPSFRALSSRSPIFARAHLAWLRQVDEPQVDLFTTYPRTSTALWSSEERLYYRGLHAWFTAGGDGKPTLTSGVMKVRARVHNNGAQPLELSSLALVASRFEGLGTSTKNPIQWELSPGATDSATPNSLAATCDADPAHANDEAHVLAPGENTTLDFCSTSVPPTVLHSLLRDSAGVTVAPLVRATAAAPQHVEVQVDYAGYQDPETHVAASDRGTTVGELFAQLSIPFSEGHNWWRSQETNVPEVTGFGLTQVRGVAADANGTMYFMVTLSRPDQPMIAFNPHAASYHFASIGLQPGDLLRVGLIRDADRDGLPADLEEQLGSSDSSRDSDLDGLDDGLEVLGWRAKPKLGSAEEITVTQQSEPTVSGEIVTDSDPTLADTDADGMDDLFEYQFKTDPRF